MLQPTQFDKVADLYDYYVDTDFDIPFWVQEAKRVRGKVLELTAGTGRISIPLLKAGVDLTCIDHSRGMLAVLQQKLENAGLSCRAIAMNTTELALRDQFDLIFIPFNSFSEILDPLKHKSTLERIRVRLMESGEFICTLHNPEIRVMSLNGQSTTLGKFPTASGGSLLVRCQFNYDPVKRLAYGFQFYELRDEAGKLTEERSLEVNFYLFSKKGFEDLVRSTGFEVVNLYGDYNYGGFNQEKSPFMIWRLKASQN